MEPTRQQIDGAGEKLSLQQLELLLSELESLPSSPVVVASLLKLLASHEPGEPARVAETAGQLVALDPALTCRLLRHCGEESSTSPGSVAGAIERIGVEGVFSLLLGPVASASAGATGLEPVPFGRHCVAVGVGTELLAGAMGLAIPAAEAYTCGLLHDIGKCALSAIFPKSYRRALQQSQANQSSIAEQERQMFGFDHCLVARRLAERWRLGESIQNVAWLHHQSPDGIPDSLPSRRLIGAVRLADTLARKREIGLSGNYAFVATAAEQAAALGLDEGLLEEISDEIVQRVEREMSQLEARPSDKTSPMPALLADANAAICQRYQSLQRMASSWADRAEAFERFRRYARRLGGESSVSDVLMGLADLVHETASARTSEGPVMVYSIESLTGEILAAESERPGQYRWRTFHCGNHFDPLRHCQPGEPALAVFEALTEDIAQVDVWIDLRQCRHQALVSAERWVGGIVIPAEPQRTTQQGILPELSALLGMTLEIIQARCRAVTLSEQMSGASQAVAQAQQSLADRRALAAAEEIASGAAHEMNTPLAVVSGRAQLMCRRAKNDDERKAWQLIADQAQRISDTISDLMEYACPPRPDPQRVDAGELVREAVNLLSARDELQVASAHVDIQIERQLSPVWVDRDQIVRSLAELIRNAVAAAGTDSPVRIEASADESAGAVRIAVSDEGPGMDERTLSHAFTPFFSSQKAGRRPGLGLCRVKRYVENNKGRVWIRSRPSEGTTVCILLPEAQSFEDKER